MRSLFPIALALATGCSLVYNFDDFETRPDAALPDADPTQLALTRVVSDPPLEGATTAVLVEGENLVSGAVVTLAGLGFSSDVVPSTTSADGSMIAFELTLPVDTGLGPADDVAIVATVSQAGVSRSIDVPVVGLREHVTSSFAAIDDAVADLATGTRFSTITIDAPIDLVGAAPFHLEATSSVSIEQPLRANGRPAVDNPAPRQAGGCPGGGSAATGGCGQLGGGAGANAGGGGGGGSQDAGTGGGSSGANGGAPTASAMLVPLADHTGRGGGGASGVGGGNGGGLIAITAETITVTSTIEVRGGAGEPSEGLVGCDAIGGPGGGGGAGGAILLRGRTSVSFSGDDQLILTGGGGGAGTAIGGGDCGGGDGSVGRLRVDTPALTGALAGVVADADVRPALGASIARQSLVRSGPSRQTLALVGDAANSPVVWVTVGPVVDEFAFAPERSIDLVAGMNQVCVHVTDPQDGQPEESRHCVDIAYLP